MGILNTLADDVPLELNGVSWFRLWRMTRPTAVLVDGETFSANAGDALAAGPDRVFKRVRFVGEGLVEHSQDPAEPFPGPVPNAAGAVLLYDSGLVSGLVDHDVDCDLSPYRGVIVYARNDNKSGQLFLTHAGDEESSMIHDFAASGMTDSLLFCAPMTGDVASPDSLSGNRVHVVTGYPSRLPGRVKFHLVDAAGTVSRFAVWGLP